MLGPITVLVDGRPLPLGAPKQRALLVALLLQAGEVVSRDRLVDAVWGEDPPASAQQSLQVYVHGLRRVLGAERIETRGAGYRLHAEPVEIDLRRYEQLTRRGRDELDAGRAAAALAHSTRRSRSGPARRSPTSPTRRSDDARSRGSTTHG